MISTNEQASKTEQWQETFKKGCAYLLILIGGCTNSLLK